MSRTARRRIGIALLACTLLCGAGAAAAQPDRKSALAIHVVRRDAPAGELAEQTFRKVLDRGPGRLDYHSEFMDAARFDDPEYEQALVQFLQRKYARLRFDVVLASSNQAMTFAIAHRDRLFPGVPIVFYASRQRPWPPLTTGVVVPFDLTGGLESAIRLHPGLRQVFVVTGASEYDRSYLAREQFGRFENRIRFTYLSGLPMPELRRRVATLPPDSVIFYTYLSEDGDGTRYVPIQALEQLASVANRPIYSWFDLALGHGVVGGRMLDLQRVMRATADLALRVLDGAPPETLPVREIDGETIAYDWRQLQRWGLSEARLPPGSILRFRQPTVWDQYKSYIVGAFLIVALQSALITGLIVQRTRRRRVESALRQSEQQARTIAEQNRDLAGRLIHAQEAERTRIARDLHDDVSQQLASVSILLSGLKRSTRRTAAAPGFEEIVATLSDRTAAAAEAIRNLSHELHPGALQHAGLVATLRRHCSDLERISQLSVAFEVNDPLESLSPDVTLCLFRVAQEALNNAVRHAKAQAIHVQLHARGETVELRVADDGVGFAGESRAGGGGLGLRSIDERVRLVRGTVKLDSSPGGGTRLVVSVPCTGSPAAVAAAT